MYSVTYNYIFAKYNTETCIFSTTKQRKPNIYSKQNHDLAISPEIASMPIADQSRHHHYSKNNI